MIVSTISADVVDSTKLTKEGMVELRDSVNAFISEIRQIDPSAWGRLTRGDFVEFVVPRPEKALRIALLLKTRLKALDLPIIKDENSQLSVYGARIAIGIGTMRTTMSISPRTSSSSRSRTVLRIPILYILARLLLLVTIIVSSSPT